MRTISLGDNADLLAYAFYCMGLRPRESLVMVGLRRTQPLAPTGAPPVGTDSASRGGLGRLRCGVVARIDLPPVRHCRQAVDDLIALLRRHGHDAVAVLLITERTPGRAAQDIRRSLRAARMPLLDLVLVSDDRYRSLTCADEDCCPAQGRPLSDVVSSPVAAEMILDGHVLVDDAEDLIADARPDPTRGLDEEALARICPLGDSPDGPSRQDRVRLLDRWGQALASRAQPDPPPLSDEDVAALGVGLDDLLFRDAVVVSLALPDGRRGLTAAHRALRGSSQAVAEASRALPDDEVLDRGRGVLSELAARLPTGRRAPALGTLAWTEWWRGDGLQARLLAQAALADRPGHRLATLVLQLLTATVPPPWSEPPPSFSSSETGFRDVVGPL